jgi:hypothetical protein
MASEADLQFAYIGQSLFQQMLPFGGGQSVQSRFKSAHLGSPVDFPVRYGLRGFRLHTFVNTLA